MDTTFAKRGCVAAHILYTNNIPAALAGPPIAVFYGADPTWEPGVLLVNDPVFEDACKVLLANGYTEVSTVDQRNHRDMLQLLDSDSGDGKRLLVPKNRIGGAIALAPASYWHFEVTNDTTIIVDGIRLPKFSSYLRALVSLLSQHAHASIPIGDYDRQALNLWTLRTKYPSSLWELSPPDHFFLEHFFSVRKTHNRKKIAVLRHELIQGLSTLKMAVASVPIEPPPKYKRNEVR